MYIQSSAVSKSASVFNEWVAFPPPGDLPDPGIEPTSLMSPALAGRFFPASTTWEAPYASTYIIHKYPRIDSLTSRVVIYEGNGVSLEGIAKENVQIRLEPWL